MADLTRSFDSAAAARSALSAAGYKLMFTAPALPSRWTCRDGRDLCVAQEPGDTVWRVLRYPPNRRTA